MHQNIEFDSIANETESEYDKYGDPAKLNQKASDIYAQELMPGAVAQNPQLTNLDPNNLKPSVRELNEYNNEPYIIGGIVLLVLLLLLVFFKKR